MRRLLIVLAIAACPAQAHAAFPGANGRLVAMDMEPSPCVELPCLPSLEQDLVSIDPDGSNIRRNSLPITYDLAGSPDGRRLAWSQSALYTSRVDGTGRRKIADDGAQPAWSPDGSRIAFWRPDDPASASRLFVVGADGRGLRPLGGRRVFGGSPTWSPDGRRIAFLRPRPGTTGARAGNALYVVRVSGGRPEPVYVPRFDWGSVETVDWSPDGRRFVVTIRFIAPDNMCEGCPEPPRPGRTARRRIGINLLERNGRVLRRVSPEDGTPVWSPDGRFLALGESSLETLRLKDGRLRTLVGVSAGSRPVWLVAR
jgi:Tol biopolymer transport system component